MTANSSVSSLPIEASAAPGCGPWGMPCGCKVNEATAIDRDTVEDAFEAGGVKVLAGDWTNGDPEITRFLESRGRAGVPLYLWYRPGAAQPEELPQVLTPAMLISRAQSSPPCKGGAGGGCF